MTKMKNLLVVSLALLCSSVSAQTACANSGAPTQTVDPSLAPKIVVWVTTVEDKFDLKASNWHGLPAKAPTRAQSSALELQAMAADWQRKAPPGSVDAIFRAAVAHGVNVQYETLMVTEDAPHAQSHQTWADTEAARASACLALIHQP